MASKSTCVVGASVRSPKATGARTVRGTAPERRSRTMSTSAASARQATSAVRSVVTSPVCDRTVIALPSGTTWRAVTTKRLEMR